MRSNSYDPVYPWHFFKLQMFFAQLASVLTGRSIGAAALDFTAMYRVLGLDWSFDPTNPDWRDYVDALQSIVEEAEGDPFNEETVDEMTHCTQQLYLARYDLIPQRGPGPHWGCFGYEVMAPTSAELAPIVHLHFGAHDASSPVVGAGPLSHERMPARMAELRAMFAHIRASESTIASTALVHGSSWLYSRPEYCRLFPPAFVATARSVRPNLRARSVWGQFMRYNWQVNEDTCVRFLENLGAVGERRQRKASRRRGGGAPRLPSEIAKIDRELENSFPYPTLAKVAPISEFYAFYGED